jgi:uncharacterized protein (DUF983 family)
VTEDGEGRTSRRAGDSPLVAAGGGVAGEESRAGLALPRWRRTARMFGRALTLRCPNCGGRPVLASWFHLRAHCPKCGLRFDRCEQDYYLGGMMFNLVIAELIFAGVFLAVLVATWPRVPWDAIQVAAPLGMIAAPFVLFPFSKLVWLAFDLMLRPPVPRDFEGAAPPTTGARSR